VVLGKCDHPELDWWSLGCITYEMLVGVPPFNDDTVEKIFHNIRHIKIEWPEIGYGEDMVTPEAVDLIKRLLEPDYTKRLRYEEILVHPFFKKVNWENHRDSDPPIEPQFESLEDTSNFNNTSIYNQEIALPSSKPCKALMQNASLLLMQRYDILKNYATKEKDKLL
jgi:serine/threonine protein kinase